MSFPPPPTEQTSKKSGTIFSLQRTPSSEPPAYSQHDMLAARYRRFGRYVHYLRAALALITLIGGITVLSCSAEALRLRLTTHLEPSYQLSVWPSTVDLRPSRAVLACGVVMTVFSLIYFVACMAPTPGIKIHILNIISTPLSFLGLFLTMFTTIYAYTINSRLSNITDAGTLESWTCRWDGVPEAPTNFQRICSRSEIALGFVVLLLIVQIFAVVTTAGGWWVESKMKKENGIAGKGQIEMVA